MKCDAFWMAISLLLIVLVFVFSAVASEVQVETKNLSYKVSGRVLDRPGGIRVGDVKVTLWPYTPDIDRKTVETAADGSFSINGVQKTGFGHVLNIGQPTGIWTDWFGIEDTGQDVDAGDLYMQPGQSISGTVREAKSLMPVPYASIRISVDGNWDEISTDAKGKYMLYVKAREVTIVCGAGGYCVLDENGNEAESVEKKITVRIGDDIREVDFRLKSSPIFCGQVVYPDGKPAGGLLIDAWLHWENRGGRGGGFSTAPGGGTRFRITTDDQGKFAGGVLVKGRMPAGLRPPTLKEIVSASLHEDTAKEKLERFRELLKEEGTVLTNLNGVVTLPDQSIGTCFEVIPIPNTHRFKPLKLVLGKCGQVTIRVVDPNGKPLNGAWIDAEGNLSPIGIHVSGHWPWWTGELECMGDGRYLMRKLIPGLRYHLNVHTPAGIAESEGFVLKPGESRDVNTVITTWMKEDSVARLMKEVQNGKNKRGAYERMIAAYLLGQLGDTAKEAVPILIQQSEIDLIADTRHRIVEAMGRIGDIRALGCLRQALEDEEDDVRSAAAVAIVQIESENE